MLLSRLSRHPLTYIITWHSVAPSTLCNQCTLYKMTHQQPSTDQLTKHSLKLGSPVFQVHQSKHVPVKAQSKKNSIDGQSDIYIWSKTVTKKFSNYCNVLEIIAIQGSAIFFIAIQGIAISCIAIQQCLEQYIANFDQSIPIVLYGPLWMACSFGCISLLCCR